MIKLAPEIEKLPKLTNLGLWKNPIPKIEQEAIKKRLLLGITESGSGRVQYISPDDIISAETSDENLEVLNDWPYWRGHPLI